tara:strand:- start:6869 stop:9364 length:2496 start_codon:yes stop_codon:yes gene_type:complete
MLLDTRFSKNIFKRINEDNITFNKEKDNSFSLNFVLPVNISNKIFKFCFIFEDKLSKSRFYDIKASRNNKIEVLYDSAKVLDSELSISLKQVDYEKYLFSDKITIYAYNKFKNILDKTEILLTKSLEDKKDLAKLKIKSLKSKKELLEEIPVLNVSKGIFNFKSVYRSNDFKIISCSIFFNNKSYKSDIEKSGLIEFNKKKFRDLYNDLNDSFYKNKSVKVNYEIQIHNRLVNRSTYHIDSIVLDRNMFLNDFSTKEYLKNRVYNSILVSNTIDKDGKNKIKVNFKNKLFKDRIKLEEVLDSKSKKISLFKGKESDNLKVTEKEIFEQDLSFYTKSSKRFDSLVFSIDNEKIRIRKEDILKVDKKINLKQKKLFNQDKQSYHKNFIKFYRVLRENFKITSTFNHSSRNFFSESFSLNVGNFKKVAESFGYNQEENDQNLDDEINFLKSSIFVIEKSYYFNNELFDVKQKNFKLEDLFDFKNIKNNTINSNKDLNLNTQSFSGFLSNRYSKKYQNLLKIVSLDDSEDLYRKLSILKNIEMFTYSVKYNIYAIPVDKKLKVIKESGYDLSQLSKRKIYVAQNPGNDSNINLGNKTLNEFLNQVLVKGINFSKRENIKKNFLSKENTDSNNIDFCKNIINNSIIINSEFLIKSFDNNLIESEVKNSSVRNSKKDLLPKVVFNRVFVEKGKIKRNRNISSSMSSINHDIVLDITDTKLDSLEDLNDIRLKYLFYKDIGYINGDISNLSKIGNDVFYSKEYINKNKSDFSSYFIANDLKNMSIKNENNKKYLCLNIENENILLDILQDINSRYKILIEYTYIKDDILIECQNIVNL